MSRIRVLALSQSTCLKGTTGIRTSKAFSLKRPELLLKAWGQRYNFVSKCRFWTYSSALAGRATMQIALRNSDLRRRYALALHSAVDAYALKNTNLDTLELYMFDSDERETFEKTLDLEPQERGYQVLLIEPYYKDMVRRSEFKNSEYVSNIFLTYLDLLHFPLRGIEQAEFLALRAPEFKTLHIQEAL